MQVIDLSKAGHGDFRRSRSRVVEVVWIFAEWMLVSNRFNVSSRLRAAVLRGFGAKIGSNCLLHHPIRVKFPWNLVVGDNCWIGDGVWFYNQDKIIIGSNVCISQESFLTTGSHDLDSTMDLRTRPITIEDGAWISSRSIVQMGVRVAANAVVTPNSVVHKDLDSDCVYGGNPCKFLRRRGTPSGNAGMSLKPDSDGGL